MEQELTLSNTGLLLQMTVNTLHGRVLLRNLRYLSPRGVHRLQDSPDNIPALYVSLMIQYQDQLILVVWLLKGWLVCYGTSASVAFKELFPLHSYHSHAREDEILIHLQYQIFHNANHLIALQVDLSVPPSSFISKPSNKCRMRGRLAKPSNLTQ